MSRTLSGLFLVKVLLIGRERGKGQIGKIPGPSPSKSGKSQKNRESPKKDKKGQKGRTSPDRETPRLKPPRLAALIYFMHFFVFFTHFFAFLRFSSLFSSSPKGQGQTTAKQKRGISLRPRLHRPRAKLPEFSHFLDSSQTLLGVVSPHLPGEILGAVLANFSQFYLIFPSFSLSLNQFQSIFPSSSVSFSQF